MLQSKSLNNSPLFVIIDELNKRLSQMENLVNELQQRVMSLECVSTKNFVQKQQGLINQKNSLSSTNESPNNIKPTLKKLNQLILSQNNKSPKKPVQYIYRELLKTPQKIRNKIRTIPIQDVKETQQFTFSSQSFTKSSKSTKLRPQSFSMIHQSDIDKSLGELGMTSKNSNEFKEILQLKRLSNHVKHDIKWSYVRRFKMKQKILLLSLINEQYFLLITSDCMKSINIFKVSHHGTLINKQNLQFHQGPVYQVALNKRKNVLLSASDDRTIGLWRQDFNSYFQKEQTLIGHKAAVICVNYNQKEDMIISGSQDTDIIIWKQEGNHFWFISQVLSKHTGYVSTLAVTQKSFASGGYDNQIILWSIVNKDYKYRQSMIGHTKPVICLNFYKTGQLLVSGSKDQSIRLWDRNGTFYSCIQVINSHSSYVKFVQFQEDILYSGSADGVLKLFLKQSDGSWYYDQKLLLNSQIQSAEIDQKKKKLFVITLSGVTNYIGLSR